MKNYNLISVIPSELMDSCNPFSFNIERLEVGGREVFAELVRTPADIKHLIIYTHLPNNSTLRSEICVQAYNTLVNRTGIKPIEFIFYFYSQEYNAFTKYDEVTDKVVKIFTVEKFLKHIGIYAEK